ncbi:MAG: lipid IV(A) 3-deoxy-D-manno-octulosonic acid transferase [Gallionella sp.]
MLKPRTFYCFALWLLLPYIFIRLAWRGRKQPEYLHHIGERFGFYSQKPKNPDPKNRENDKPVIWLHAVSVGETRATQSLVTQLRATYPGHRILLTHTTPTGRAASEQLYGNDVMRVYLPYDYPVAVHRFLNHFRPQLGMLMETEIWVNLIHACHSKNIPLLLLNARMSEKSAKGYANFAKLTHPALSALRAVAAQTDDDAARLTQLGANNVSVMGNLKFDIEPPPTMLTLGKQLREQFGVQRKVFLAASTRTGEEALLLDALKPIQESNHHAVRGEPVEPPVAASNPFDKLRANGNLLVVIVPRHPQRFDEVANLLEQRNIKFQRRSAAQPITPDTTVVLGDSMGEMFAYYAAADLAFIGGSLLPFGGQNLIESCAVGTPVMIGPHTYNFTEAARLSTQCGAAIQIQDAKKLIAEAQRLLADAASLNKMRTQCLNFVNINRGATDKALLIINSIIDDGKEAVNHES